MIDKEKLEKTISSLEHCITADDCRGCPFWGIVSFNGMCAAAGEAMELLKEQQRIIEQYHKADGFLAAHGWKWG